MSDQPKPPKPFQVLPGESPWEALARELATNPDSPASLRLMSHVNQVLRPRTLAADQLTEALADAIEQEGELAQASVAAAVQHYEKATGTPMDDELLAVFREDAQKLADRRRRQPPALESIVAGCEQQLDAGYSLGLDLGGLRGTWHRLWAALAMQTAWAESPEGLETVNAIRAQFEQQLGRALSGPEWEQLSAHAKRHGLRMARGEG